MFSVIASFPFQHKLGRVMGKKRSIWIHASLASIVVYIALMKEESSNCNFLKYLFTIQSIFIFSVCFPIRTLHKQN